MIRVTITKEIGPHWCTEKEANLMGELALIELLQEDVPALLDGAEWQVTLGEREPASTELERIRKALGALPGANLAVLAAGYRKRALKCNDAESTTDVFRDVLMVFADVAEMAVAHYRMPGQGPVPEDFKDIPPAVSKSLSWWARRFREALAGKVDVFGDRAHRRLP
jgi:hypothetical protein